MSPVLKLEAVSSRHGGTVCTYTPQEGHEPMAIISLGSTKSTSSKGTSRKKEDQMAKATSPRWVIEQWNGSYWLGVRSDDAQYYVSDKEKAALLAVFFVSPADKDGKRFRRGTLHYKPAVKLGSPKELTQHGRRSWFWLLDDKAAKAKHYTTADFVETVTSILGAAEPQAKPAAKAPAKGKPQPKSAKPGKAAKAEAAKPAKRVAVEF